MPQQASHVEDSLTLYLRTWLETPYRAGQCCKGEGVDCVRLVNSAMAFRNGVAPPELPRYAQDAAFHDERVVGELMRFWMSLFPHRKVSVMSRRLSGDVLVVASGERNQTHVGIMGNDGFMYHAIAPAVCRTSPEEFRSNDRIKRVFRACT